ncbi:chaperonin 10-like protein [Aspergillus californicus]
MEPCRKALFVDDHATFSVRDRNADYLVGNGEVLVENLFSGVNPADVKHATLLGIRNTVLGYDFCGHVVKTNHESNFTVGNIVAGYTPSGVGRDSKFGTHQAFTVLPESMLFKVPTNLPHEDAACLTVVTMTAADALFNVFDVPLPAPSTRNDANDGTGPLLIWGASSSVGSCALQFAAASGCYPIFVTASTARHENLQALGATRCFDYSSPAVLEEIREALESLQSGPIQYAIDAVGTDPNPLAADGIESILSPKAKLISVVLRNDERFKMPTATPHLDFRIHPAGLPHAITIPGRPEARQKAWAALLWAIENYGRLFKLPPVEVFRGSAEEALEELQKVANGRRGYGKLAIPQPLK